MFEFTALFFQKFLKTLDDFSLFLILGFFIAGFIRIFIYPSRIKKLIGKRNIWSVLWASIIGVPMPLCSCSVIPVGVSLRKSGASDGATISFLTSTPVTGVDSIAISFAMLPPQLAIARPIAALILGLVAGLVKMLFSKDTETETKGDESEDKKSIKDSFLYVVDDLFPSLANSLMLGVLIAAFLLTAIDFQWIPELKTLSQDNKLTGILLMIIAGVPLYVCATGSTPIAAALLMSGVSPGMVLAFLISGPATNITTVLAVNSMFKIRGAVLYLIVIILGAIGGGYFVDMLWPNMQISHNHDHHHHHESSMFWLYRIATIILLLGFAHYYLGVLRSKYFRKKAPSKGAEHLLKINNMVCMGCVKKIEKVLSDASGVSILEADPKNHVLRLKTNNNDELNKAQIKLKDAGFPAE